MSIIGFDLECANTYSLSAICWAGIVKFDNNFNLIEEKEILINPECKKFCVGGNIEFPFTIADLKKYPKFAEVYKELTADFLDDNIIVGHSITNDFSMMFSAYRKNKLKCFKARFLDSQIFYSIYKGTNEAVSLGECAKEFDILLDEHNPKSDALTSVLIIKSILNKMDLTLDEFMNKYEMNFGEVSSFFIKEINCNAFEDKKRYKLKKCNEIFDIVKTSKNQNNYNLKAVWFKSDLFAQFNLQDVILETINQFRVVFDRKGASINVTYLKPTKNDGKAQYSLIEYIKKVVNLKPYLVVDDYAKEKRYKYVKGFNLNNYIIKGLKPSGKSIQNEFTGKVICFSKGLTESYDFIENVRDFVVNIGARYTENIKLADVFVVESEREIDNESDHKIKYLIKNNLLKQKIVITKEEFINMQQNVK